MLDWAVQLKSFKRPELGTQCIRIAELGLQLVIEIQVVALHDHLVCYILLLISLSLTNYCI